MRGRTQPRTGCSRNFTAEISRTTRSLQDWLRRGWDKLLIDPPRIGAGVVVEHVPLARPSRIVYVSCNPDSLARDAARLVGAFGYRLRRTGLVDMFPHTSHVESVTEFSMGGVDEPLRNGSDRPR